MHPRFPVNAEEKKPADAIISPQSPKQNMWQELIARRIRANEYKYNANPPVAHPIQPARLLAVTPPPLPVNKPQAIPQMLARAKQLPAPQHTPAPPRPPGKPCIDDFQVNMLAPQQAHRLVPHRVYPQDELLQHTKTKNEKKELRRLTNSFKVSPEVLTFDEVLGQGSFGKVYKGTWHGSVVAIKTLLLPADVDASEKAITDLKKEALVMKSLVNPYLMRINAYCFENSTYAIVMDYMEHGSLRDVLINKENKISRRELMRQVACGMEYLHQKNIIHRDLKSLNIFVGHQLELRIGDFGLAKIQNPSLNDAINNPNGSGIKGTIAWMAPELFSRERKRNQASFASDVYSMGVTFCEIVNRDYPHIKNTRTNNDIMVAVQKGARPGIARDCPTELKSIIEKCWEQDPAMRPSAQQVVGLIKGTLFKPAPQAIQMAKPSTMNYVGLKK